jgi:hypothetical protein
MRQNNSSHAPPLTGFDLRPRDVADRWTSQLDSRVSHQRELRAITTSDDDGQSS